MDTVKNIIRWIGIIPAFAAVYLIAYYIVYFSQSFYSDSDSWLIIYVAPVIGSLVAGFFSIVYAVKVAPNYKPVVAFVLLILMVMASGIFIFFSAFRETVSNTIALIASLLGTIGGYFMAKDEENLEGL